MNEIPLSPTPYHELDPRFRGNDRERGTFFSAASREHQRSGIRDQGSGIRNQESEKPFHRKERKETHRAQRRNRRHSARREAASQNPENPIPILTFPLKGKELRASRGDAEAAKGRKPPLKRGLFFSAASREQVSEVRDQKNHFTAKNAKNAKKRIERKEETSVILRGAKRRRRIQRTPSPS